MTRKVESQNEAHISLGLKRLIIQEWHLPCFCFVMFPPMCSIENQYISSSPSGCATINTINSQGLYTLLT